MTKPVVFIDVNTSTYETLGNCQPGVLLGARDGYFAIELQNQAQEQPGKIKVVKNGGGNGVLLVEIDRPVVWVAAFHCIIFKALERLFQDVLVLDYMPNQIGAYRFTLASGAAHEIDPDVFKEPIAKGFGSTLEGTDSKEQIRADRIAVRNEHFRAELKVLSEQIDTLMAVKDRLPAVHETEFRAGVGIGYVYNDLHFYVNVIDGEMDQAATMFGFEGEIVGIFLYENVFVTKQRARKDNDIDIGMLSPADFSTMMENYANLAEVGSCVVSRRSRGGRDRDRDSGGRGENRRERGYRGR